MSASPLANSKHETYALLICAGFEPSEAYARAGYKPDLQGGNATKLMTRPDVAERIMWLKGEHADKPAPVEPSADPDSLMKHLIGLAYNAATPPATQLRAIELLSEMNGRASESEYWPTDHETFDLTRLSAKQRRLCELYAARPAQQSPAETILERLSALRAKHDAMSDFSPPKELVSAHRSQPSLVLEEQTITTSTSMRLTSAVSGHGAR